MIEYVDFTYFLAMVETKTTKRRTPPPMERPEIPESPEFESPSSSPLAFLPETDSINDESLHVNENSNSINEFKEIAREVVWELFAKASASVKESLRSQECEKDEDTSVQRIPLAVPPGGPIVAVSYTHLTLPTKRIV